MEGTDILELCLGDDIVGKVLQLQLDICMDLKERSGSAREELVKE